MNAIRSFSGCHAFRPSCLLEAVEVDEWEDNLDPDTGELLDIDEEAAEQRAVDKTARLVEAIDAGRCPRCGQPLPTPPELPAGSRATHCRCIPVCNDCGKHEALYLPAAGDVVGVLLADWPLEREVIDAEIRHAEMHASTSVVVLGAGSDRRPVLVDDDGAGRLDLGPPRGGWAQYGFDDDEEDAQ